jgi:hypothetical protein
MKAAELALLREDSWRNIPIALTTSEDPHPTPDTLHLRPDT